MNAKISEIQYFCLHDGPGIRTTIFFAGCPLHCSWCHNPESSVLSHLSRPVLVLPQILFKEIKKDLMFYGDEGGVTCSGGEPLAQAEAMYQFLKICRNNGVSAAIETSLYASWESIEKLIPLVDLWIADIKTTDNQKHILYTGMENILILENLNKLLKKAQNIWVRMPIVPGIQDKSDVEMLARLIKHQPAVKKTELIPFHLLGSEKYEQYGVPCPYPSEREPTSEEMKYLETHLNIEITEKGENDNG